MAWSRSALTVIVAFGAIYSRLAYAVPVTVDLYPSDQLHIVQGTPPHHAPPDPEKEYELRSPLDFVPSSRIIASEGFPAYRHPHAQEYYVPPYAQAEAARESVHGTGRESGYEERVQWRPPGLEQQQTHDYNDGRANWYPRHGQVNQGYRRFNENQHHQHPHQEVWDNGLRRHPQAQQGQYYPQPQAQAQQKQDEQRRHSQHSHEEAGSHICVDGKCYVIQSQSYDAGTASEVSRQRPLLVASTKPAEQSQREKRVGNEAPSNTVKRSTEDVNDVRKRYQQAQLQYQQPTQQHQHYQHQPQRAQGQQYQQQYQQYQQHQRSNYQPQQTPDNKGQGKRLTDSGRKQHQQYQKQDKSEIKSAALAKAIIDFEKALDMADEFSYVYPIVRNSYDEVSNVLVIELDYSEAPITSEATVETEDD